MTKAAQTKLNSLTIHARAKSENGSVGVRLVDGVYWLVLERPGDAPRTLQSVGTVALPVRYMREQITTYFEGK